MSLVVISPRFSWLGKESLRRAGERRGLQIALTLVLIVTSTFDSMIFSGAILTFNSLLTVLGVWVLRVREPELKRPFRVPLCRCHCWYLVRWRWT